MMASKDPSPVRDLITANHILHHHQVVDGYGHISMRNPKNPHTFFMSHSIAPALVSSPADIVEYNIEDASPVKSGVSEGFKERCIHSEILKKYPGVNSVVHSHSEAVLPYGISGVEMKACSNVAGFLGTHVPVFDIAEHYTRTSTHDLLVNTPNLGSALASHFSNPDSYVARVGTAGAALASTFFSSKDGDNNNNTPTADAQPDHAVVLMRGHGFTALGNSVPEAVFRAVYTLQNARVQTTALMLRDVKMGAVERGRGREEREKGVQDEGIRWLGDKEVGGCRKMGLDTARRSWGLWVREVEANGFFVNEA
ncbi:class II aldolase and Adducin N-terminal domain-containing protein [Usnea florida]